MELQLFHDPISRTTVLTINLPDYEASELPSYLIQPKDSDILTQLRYFAAVAEYLQNNQEESMAPQDPENDEQPLDSPEPEEILDDEIDAGEDETSDFEDEEDESLDDDDEDDEDE